MINQYWPILVGLLLIILTGGMLLFVRRGQRVTLSSGSDSGAPRPTLARNAPTKPVAAGPRPMTIDDVRASIVKSTHRDNLMEIKGITAPIATLLVGVGFQNYEQLARLTDEQAEVVNRFIKEYNASAVKDRWAEQAALLAAGDFEGYAAKFGDMEPVGG